MGSSLQIRKCPVKPGPRIALKIKEARCEMTGMAGFMKEKYRRIYMEIKAFLYK
jgi:hypothetical protein